MQVVSGAKLQVSVLSMVTDCDILQLAPLSRAGLVEGCSGSEVKGRVVRTW